MIPKTIPTVAQVRSWCRIDDSADDGQLDFLIAAGTAYASRITGLNLSVACPTPVAQAIAVFVADNYANREGQLVGSATVRMLLDPYRLVE